MKSKQLLAISFLVFLNYFFQFLFNWLIVTRVGPSNNTDIFFGALAVPQMVLNVVSGAFIFVITPILSRLKGNELLNEVWNFLYAMAILFMVLFAIFYISSNLWLTIVLPGFNQNDLSTALTILRIQLISVVFSSLTSVIWSFNNSQGKYYRIEITSVIINVISLCFLYQVMDKWGIIGASYVMLARALMPLIFLFNTIGRLRKFNYNSSIFKLGINKVVPLVFSSAYYKSDQVIEKYLTSTSASGMLTILHFSQQLYGAGVSILNRSLVTTIIPQLTNADQFFYPLYLKRLKVLSLIGAVPLVILFAYGRDILNFTPGLSRFDSSQLQSLYYILIFSSGYWLGDILGALTAAAFYSKGDTKTPSTISIITFTIYIPLKIVAFRYYGIYGLCVASSIYFVSNFLIKQIIISKRYSIKQAG